MQVAVTPFGWGVARTVDLKALLNDTASHLNRQMRAPLDETLVVVPAPCDDPIPRTHYRPSHGDSFFIQLTARDRCWCQYAYQFAHEFCHVLSEYERLQNSSNNWFHEAICELASVFALRRMAERWPTCAPYPNWADYAKSLTHYVQELISDKGRQLPIGMTLSAWLLSEEASLRNDEKQRDKNAVVAYCLLAVFESEPSGWNAVRKLPNSSTMLKNYLCEWHSQVDPMDRPFVNRIIQLFDE